MLVESDYDDDYGDEDNMFVSYKDQSKAANEGLLTHSEDDYFNCLDIN